MLIESLFKHNFQILKISQNSDKNNSFSDLKEFIEELLKKGNTNIALSFSEDFHIHSKPIGILVVCNEMIKKYDGTLAIINPNSHISELLKMTGVDKQITIFDSENDLKPKNFI